MKRALLVGLGLVTMAVLPAWAVELKLKWEPGKRYHFENSTQSAMKMPLPGQGVVDTSTRMSMQMLHATSLHEKGVRVATEFESIKMRTAMPGFVIEYDSKNPQGGLLDQVLQPLADTKYATIYGQDGKLLEFEGLDEVQGAAQMGLGKDELEAMTRQSAQFVPNKDVQVGESWEVDVDLPMGGLGGDIKLKYTLKLEGVDEKDGKQIARISLTGKKGEAEKEEGETVLEVEVNKVSGTMAFDVALGQPIEITTAIDLEMALPAGVPQEPGAPGRMPIKSNSVQKLIKVEDAAPAEEPAAEKKEAEPGADKKAEPTAEELAEKQKKKAARQEKRAARKAAQKAEEAVPEKNE